MLTMPTTKLTRYRAVRAAASSVRADRGAAARELRHAAPLTATREPGRIGTDRARTAAAIRKLRPPIDSRDENLVLTLALRRLGYDARLVLGREYAPQNRPASCTVWVEVDGRVVSTAEPVDEVFRTLATLPGEHR